MAKKRSHKNVRCVHDIVVLRIAGNATRHMTIVQELYVIVVYNSGSNM